MHPVGVLAMREEQGRSSVKLTTGAIAMTFAADGGKTALAQVLKDYSAEVTAPDRRSLDAAADLMDAGSRVYIASLPSDTADRLVAAAKHLADAGLVPVPHIVARNIESLSALENLLKRLSEEAGVDRALILGGDRDKPAGDLECSLQINRSGLLEKYGITKIAIGTYPEGHPRISDEILDRALVDKIAAAREHGLECVLISQVCFDPEPVVRHVRRLRAMGISERIRIGVAGPAKRTTLLKYAVICGVGASMRALKERQALAKNLMAGETPEKILTALSEAQAAEPSLNIWGIHFFTFAAFSGTIEFVKDMSERYK
jgi:methylenetetrahydrofolate reductase (NADPH)